MPHHTKVKVFATVMEGVHIILFSDLTKVSLFILTTSQVRHSTLKGTLNSNNESVYIDKVGLKSSGFVNFVIIG